MEKDFGGTVSISSTEPGKFTITSASFAPVESFRITPEQDLQRHRCSIGEHEADENSLEENAFTVHRMENGIQGKGRSVRVCRHCNVLYAVKP